MFGHQAEFQERFFKVEASRLREVANPAPHLHHHGDGCGRGRSRVGGEGCLADEVWKLDRVEGLFQIHLLNRQSVGEVQLREHSIRNLGLAYVTLQPLQVPRGNELLACVDGRRLAVGDLAGRMLRRCGPLCTVQTHRTNQFDGGAKAALLRDKVALVEVFLEGELLLVVGVERAQVLRKTLLRARWLKQAVQAVGVGAVRLQAAAVVEAGVRGRAQVVLVEAGVGGHKRVGHLEF